MNTCYKLLSVLPTCFCIIAAKQKYLQVPIVQAFFWGLAQNHSVAQAVEEVQV